MNGIIDALMGNNRPEVPTQQGMVPIIPNIKERKQTQLSPKEEERFQKEIKSSPWYLQYKTKYKEEPNLTDPNYDYREAWKQGVKPEINPTDNMYHWSDRAGNTMLKSIYHDAAWAQPFMDQYKINPDNLSPNDPMVMNYKRAWQAKYPAPNSVGQGAGGGGGSGLQGGS